MSTRKLQITKKTVRKNKKTIKNTSAKHQLTQTVRKQIIHKFLTILNCVKLYHWSTASYSQHKATDMLYEELNKHIDAFVEIMLAKTNKRISNIQISTCNVPNKVEFVKKARGFKQYLYGLNRYMDPVLDSNLYNIRDEMLGVVDQLLYLFQLK